MSHVSRRGAVAVQLNHGNVLQTYEFGHDGERHVIVMEHLEEQSLAPLLKRAERNGQPLSLGRHLRLALRHRRSRRRSRDHDLLDDQQTFRSRDGIADQKDAHGR